MLSQEDEVRLVSVPRTYNNRNSRDVIVLTLYFMTWAKNCGHFGPTWPKTVAVLKTKLIILPSKTRQNFGFVHVAEMFSVKEMYKLLISVQAK